jgi:exocyst complex protein 7
VNQINDTYRQLLEEDAQPLEPLHYITKQIPFPTISSDKAQTLGQLATAITSAGSQASRLGQRDDDAAARIYAEIRGDYLQNSLQNLASASVSTSKRKGDDSAVYRGGSSGIGTYATSIEAMFRAEAENTNRIFRNDPGRIFAMTCGKALAAFSRTLAELNNIVKSRMLTDCFLAYEIIELMTPLGYRIESHTGQLRTQFAEAVRPVRETARASLIELIVQTRRQAEAASLPPDGKPIPLVSQTATRLQNLVTFDQTLLPILTSIGEGNWRTQQQSLAPSQSTISLELTPSSENPTILSHYLLDYVDTLFTSLNTRAQAVHRTKALQGMFLLNSMAVITRAINSSHDLARYLGIHPHKDKIDSYRKTATSIYLKSWQEPISLLMDTIHTTAASRPLSGQAIDSTSIIKSLNSKDKDKTKEKFKLFNQSFDDLVVRHKSLYMENEVRSSLGREIQNMIEPMYGRFWDRYHEVDKGKGKVVKYGKVELSTILASL